MPHGTGKQVSALLDMNAALQSQTQTLNNARAQVTVAALASPRDDTAIQSKIDAIEKAGFVLARARADSVAKLQAGPEPLTPSKSLGWWPRAAGTGLASPNPSRWTSPITAVTCRSSME